jgi:transcription elongation factor GreA-like protein|tara:strand:- start:8011 stop:8178 length:168 start_codon:yes stop_codon:yes gene_type:complete
LNDFLTPGQFVTNPKEPEWGIGQVQSVIDGKITVNFEQQGKVVINGSVVELILVN